MDIAQIPATHKNTHFYILKPSLETRFDSILCLLLVFSENRQILRRFMQLRKMRTTIFSKVINVGSDTFGNPIFHEGLQNQPFSRIISDLGCFAQLCQLVAKCKKWTFKVNFLCQKSSESFSIFFSLKNTNLEAHFFLLAFFDKINFLTTLLLKLSQIFDEVAKLGKSTQDAYNPGKWLIL